MIAASDDGDATGRAAAPMIAATKARSGASRWATRLLLLGVALANIECLGDFVPPKLPVYEFDAVNSTVTLAAGDTASPPAVVLKVDGKVQSTSVRVEIEGISDIVAIDTAKNKIIVLKPGKDTVRVVAVNAGLATDTVLHADITIIAIAPRAAIAGPDTAYSIGDTLRQVGRATTKSGATISGVPLVWSVVAPDSGVAAFAQIGDTARLIALKNGDVTIKAQVDTGSLIKTVRVRQRVAKIVISPPADSATPGKPAPTYTAQAFDAKNAAMTGVTFTWSSLNVAVATIGASSGTVTRVATGQTAITAQNGTVGGYALLNVVAPVVSPVNLWAPMTSNTSAQLNSVFGTNANTIFAVGNGGVIRRWNGTSWTTHTNSSTENLSGVWSMATLAYAVGANGTIRTYDGISTWTAATSPTTANLTSIWGSSPAAIHIGGVNTILSNTTGAFTAQSVSGTASGIWGPSPIAAMATSSSGLALFNYNGTSWTTGATLPGTGTLNSVWGLSASQVYAVGGGSVRTFNGTSWAAAQVGDGSVTMNAAWGTGPSDMYLVGNNGLIARQGVGGAWLTESSGSSATLRSIWGLGNDVFIVGDGGTILRGYRGASVTLAPLSATLNSAGATQAMTATAKDNTLAAVTVPAFTWTSSDTTVARVNTSGVVTAISTGTINVCAQAPGGAQACSTVSVNLPLASIVVSPNGTTLQSGTTTLTATGKDAAGGTVPAISPVWSSLNTAVATVNASTGVVTAVSSGQVAILATSGAVSGYAIVNVMLAPSAPVNLWTTMDVSSTSDLWDVFGFSGSDIYIVGDGGTVRRYNGTTWAAVATGAANDLYTVCGPSSDRIWIGGNPTANNLVHFNGTNWTSMNTSGSNIHVVHSVWCGSGSDVFAVGNSGTAFRYNASTWPAIATGSSENLLEVWGASQNSIIAVGTTGTTLHFNGSTWTSKASGTTQHLQAVWGTGTNEAFAVGTAGTILRYNGAAWSAMTSNTPRDLLGIWGSNGADVYAVGTGGAIQRYNGTSWSTMISGNGAALHAVWGTSSGDVWIVGAGGTVLRGTRGASVTVAQTNVSEDLVLNQGETLSLSAVARTSTGTAVAGATFTWSSSNESVVSVSGTGTVTALASGTSNICATAPGGAAGCVQVTVGATVASIDLSTTGFTLTGGTATIVPTARDGAGATMSGISYSFTSLNTAVATVSSSGVVTPVSSGQATIIVSAGSASNSAVATVALPSAVPVNLWLPAATGVSTRLNGVWGSSSAAAFAVGNSGFVSRFNSATVTNISPSTSEQLNGVAGTSATDVFITGTRRTLLRYDGSAWSTINAGAALEPEFRGIWAAASNAVFVTATAGGVQGEIRRYNGSALSQMTTGHTAQFWGLWGSSASNVFAVGDGGAIIKYNGTSWGTMTSNTSASLRAAWGTSGSDVFAVGDGGSIVRYNGSTWNAMTNGVSTALSAVWGSSSSDVYAVGASGTILRYDGSVWTSLSSPTTLSISGVWGTNTSDVYLVAGDGTTNTIYRGVRGATLTLAPTSVTLASTGQTQQITPTLKDAAGAGLGGAPFTWSSSNESAATVSSTGLVTAIANGAASVCATAPGGVQGCVSVTVGVTPASVVVSPNGVSLTGTPTTLSAVAKDAGGTTISNTSFVWSSANPAVATVNASTGVVTPVSSGQAAIAASVGGVTGYAVITVNTASPTPVNLWASVASPTAQNLYDVWAADASNVFAVGDKGVIVRYNGTSWSRVDSGAIGDLTTVSGTSASNVYAGGGLTQVRRFDGSTWTTVNTVGPRALWSATPTATYSVKTYVNASVFTRELERLNGANVSSVVTNTANTNTPWALWGLATDRIYSVSQNGEFLTWDGTTWNVGSYGVGGTPNAAGVWAPNASDVYVAVPNSNVLKSSNGGGSWSTLPAMGYSGCCTDVWGTGNNEVWAALGNSGGVISYYNGSTWNDAFTNTTTLRSVGGTSNGDMWAVGNGGTILRGVRGASVSVSPSAPTITGVGATQQMTPTAKDANNNTIAGALLVWTSQTPSVATVSSSGLVTAVASGTTTLCATAPGGAQACTQVTVELPTASIVVSPNGASISGGNTTFIATAKDVNGNTIAGKTFTWTSLNTNVATINSSTGQVTPVGSGQVVIAATVDGITGYGTVTVAIPGYAAVNLWETMTSGVTEDLNGVWGTSNSNVFAVGLNGKILRFNGTAWSTLTTGTTNGFRAVSGVSASEVYAVATNQVWAYNGATWTPTTVAVTPERIWLATPRAIFLSNFSNGGGVYRYDGSTATRVLGAGEQGWGAVWGTSATDLYAAFNTTVYRYDGSSSANTNAGAACGTSALSGVSATQIFATGYASVCASQSLFVYNGTSWSSQAITLTPGNAIWGSSASDVYALGQVCCSNIPSRIMRYNGGSITEVPGLEVANGLKDIWGAPGANGTVFAVGGSGTILRGHRGGSVVVSPTSPTVTAIGSTQAMSAVGKNASNATVNVASFTWTSDDASIATVNSSGVVTAVAVGTANICATAPGGAFACQTVTVAQAVASITMTTPGVSLSSGTTTLSATAKDANNNNISSPAFTWSSLNTNVATVNSSTGVVTPVKSGQATICATANGVTSCSLVTVTIDGAVAVNIWRADTTGVTSNQLNQVWSAGDGTVFAVGTNGTILRRTGSAWSVMSTPTSQHLDGLWGTSSSNVFAAGENGVILRFDGNTWTQMTSNTSAKLLSVWGSSPTDVFVTGVNGLIVHYDGSSWSPMTSNASANLWGVWGLSSTNVFAVGESGTIVQYNGSTWSAMTSNTTERMVDVWGVSPTAVFAAGDFGVRFFNGSTWSMISGTDGTYQDVRGSFFSGSSGDVFAIGLFGELRQLHGTTWGANELWPGNPALHGMWATNTGDVFVVGDGGTMIRGVRGGSVTVAPTTPTLTSVGATQQMTPTAKDASNNTVTGVTYTWSLSDSTKATVSSSGLVTATANGTTSVCATALGGAQGCTTVTIAQAAASVTVTPASASLGIGSTTLTASAKDANGNTISGQTFTWSSVNPSVATVNSSGFVSTLTSGQVAIAATAGTATGYSLLTVSAGSVTAVNLWATVTSPTGQNLWDVWAADASHVFAVGNNGVVIRYNGTSWAKIDSGNAASLRGVSGTSATDVIAVGADNHIRRYNGSTWSDMSVSQADYVAAWAIAPNNLFAAGVRNGFGRNYVARYTGSSWSKIDSLDVGVTSQAALGIWGTSASNYVTTAEGGLLRRWDGVSWSQSTLTNADLFGVWGSSVSDMYIAAGNGAGFGVFKSTDGGQNWSAMAASPNVFDVWGTSASELFVASSSLGHVGRYNGTTWNDYDLGTGANYRAITGTSNGDVWAVGIGGIIARGVRGASVSLVSALWTLAVGGSVQETPTAKDASNNVLSGVSYTWSTTNASVATVNSSGLITAVGSGSATICATAVGGAQGCSLVSVGVQFDQQLGSVNAFTSSSFSLTGVGVSGPNRLIVCVVGINPLVGGPSVTSVTYDDGAGGGTQAFTQLGGQYNATSAGQLWRTYYLTGPTTGNGRRVNVTLSGSPTNVDASCVSYTGVNQTTPFGSPVTSNGTSGSASLQLTSALDGSLPWAVLISSGGGYAAGAGTTDRQTIPNGAKFVDGNTYIANGNTHTFNWTYVTQFGSQGAMIRPAP